jgi:hypothetical protein
MTQDELRKVLEETADEAGRVTREGVVAAAADPGHPLHADPKFHWGDDAEAARQHRLEYAGRLIRRVYVVVRPVQARRARVPYFVRDPRADENEPGHVPLQSVEASSPNAAVVAQDELRRLVGGARRAAAVASQLGIDGLESELAALLAMAMRIQGRLVVPVLADVA